MIPKWAGINLPEDQGLFVARLSLLARHFVTRRINKVRSDTLALVQPHAGLKMADLPD